MARPAPLFRPNEALALCIGDEPRTLDGLVTDLWSDLEEMRWDSGSAAGESPLIPALEALVQEAGDPEYIARGALEKLVRANVTTAGTAPTAPKLAALLEGTPAAVLARVKQLIAANGSSTVVVKGLTLLIARLAVAPKATATIRALAFAELETCYKGLGAELAVAMSAAKEGEPVSGVKVLALYAELTPKAEAALTAIAAKKSAPVEARLAALAEFARGPRTPKRAELIARLKADPKLGGAAKQVERAWGAAKSRSTSTPEELAQAMTQGGRVFVNGDVVDLPRAAEAAAATFETSKLGVWDLHQAYMGDPPLVRVEATNRASLRVARVDHVTCAELVFSDAPVKRWRKGPRLDCHGGLAVANAEAEPRGPEFVAASNAADEVDEGQVEVNGRSVVFWGTHRPLLWFGQSAAGDTVRLLALGPVP